MCSGCQGGGGYYLLLSGLSKYLVCVVDVQEEGGAEQPLL